MKNKPELRRGTIADLDTIARFNTLMAKETEEITLDSDTVRKGTEAVIRDPERGFYLIAEIDGQPVGQLMITPEWSDWRNQWFWWIQSVYVATEFRRRGIFATLFNEARVLAKKQGDVAGIRLYVDENNIGAQKTYEALGMEESNYQLYEIEW